MSVMLPSQRSFKDKLTATKAHLIYHFTATDLTGKVACYFVLIEPSKEIAFKRALNQKQGVIDFAAYGQIIASCYGEVPTPQVKEHLLNHYGFDISSNGC